MRRAAERSRKGHGSKLAIDFVYKADQHDGYFTVPQAPEDMGAGGELTW